MGFSAVPLTTCPDVAIEGSTVETYRGDMTTAFPPYTYLPGHRPHPTRDPEGHGFEILTQGDAFLSLTAWESCEAYRLGVELFNQGYYWEAHEAWEQVWRTMGKHTHEGQFIQGLIKVSAAAIKIRQGHSKAARSLLTQSSQHFQKVISKHTETNAGGLHLKVLERWCRDFRDEVADIQANPDLPLETVLPPLQLMTTTNC